MRRKGSQTDLAGALGRLTTSLDRRSGGAYSQVRAAEAWERVAGPVVTEHTTGAHLRDGELVIHVDSHAWATELTGFSGRYLEEIRKEMGSTPVRSMRFIVSRKVDQRRDIAAREDEDAEFYEPQRTERVALSETELAQVLDSARVIDDEELREAVVRATVADLEWKKGRR